jgi:hypothetical protein
VCAGAVAGAWESRAEAAQGWGLAEVLCGWRWGPGHCLPWWLLAELPWPTQGLRTGEVGLRANLQLVEVALPLHKDCSPPHAGGKIGARGPALVCR